MESREAVPSRQDDEQPYKGDFTHYFRRGRERLTTAQEMLYSEIRAAKSGVLYIGRYNHHGRTAEVLVRKGYIKVVEPDYSMIQKDGYSLVE